MNGFVRVAGYVSVKWIAACLGCAFCVCEAQAPTLFEAIRTFEQHYHIELEQDADLRGLIQEALRAAQMQARVEEIDERARYKRLAIAYLTCAKHKADAQRSKKALRFRAVDTKNLSQWRTFRGLESSQWL